MVIRKGRWSIFRKEEQGTLAHAKVIYLDLGGVYIDRHTCKSCQAVHLRFVYFAEWKLYFNEQKAKETNFLLWFTLINVHSPFAHITTFIPEKEPYEQDICYPSFRGKTRHKKDTKLPKLSQWVHCRTKTRTQTIWFQTTVLATELTYLSLSDLYRSGFNL